MPLAIQEGSRNARRWRGHYDRIEFTLLEVGCSRHIGEGREDVFDCDHDREFRLIAIQPDNTVLHMTYRSLVEARDWNGTGATIPFQPLEVPK